MARKKDKEENARVSAPDWLLTFSDCMTLLLTFFVLLLSFAQFKEEKFKSLGESFSQALPSVGQSPKLEAESLQKKDAGKQRTRVSKGTETRPPVENINTSTPMAEKKPIDFRNVKVFSIASSEFFWGDGNAITIKGRTVLDALAVLLGSRPSRMVISEHGDGSENDELSLSRTWAVVRYMTRQKNVPLGKFSITSANMMGTKYSEDSRMFEITMLDRDIYE